LAAAIKVPGGRPSGVPGKKKGRSKAAREKSIKNIVVPILSDEAA